AGPGSGRLTPVCRGPPTAYLARFGRTGMALQRVVIVGAAGRDFHNFNLLYRGRPEFQVVAFTAAQIPNISGRVYPAGLAGPGYPKGIPIVPESELKDLIRRESVDTVLLSYSDLPYAEVMHKASISMAAGAAFMFAGPKATMLPSTKPVVSICAVRTGAGKSPLTRYVSAYFRTHGKRVAIVRHPMPYGDLMAQAVQRFATMEDLTRAECTIEEREEYEPHLRDGVVVFGRGLRSDPPTGRGRGGHRPLGRREQRLLVLRAQPLVLRRRPVPGRSRARLLSGRGKLPNGGRDRDQQDRLGPGRGGQDDRAERRAGEPDGEGGPRWAQASRSRSGTTPRSPHDRGGGRADRHARRARYGRWHAHRRTPRGRDHRPAAVRGRQHRRGLQAVHSPQADPSRDGVRRGSGERPRGDHPKVECRVRRGWKPGRPGAPRARTAADHLGPVRVRRPRERRVEGPRGVPSEVREVGRAGTFSGRWPAGRRPRSR